MSAGPASLRLGRRGDGDLAADDVLLELVDLRLAIRRDLAVELVVLRDRHAVVLQRAQEAAARLALGRLQRGLLHRVRDVLDHGGEEDGALVSRRRAAVDVDPDDADLASGALRRDRRTETRATGDREDDVGALRDERVADRLALVLVGEALGEGAVLRGFVPAEHLDALAL